MAPSRLSLNILSFWPTLLMLFVAMLLPLYGPYMGYAEGAIFPVTTKIEPFDIRPVEGGIEFRFRYLKLRACEYVNTAASVDGVEVKLNIAPNQDPVTRLPGPQTSSIWFAVVTSLEGAEIWFIHRCSPYWLTASRAYP